MAIANFNGIEGKDLSFYVTEFERIFKSAWGQDLIVTPETPQGQFIGLAALAIEELDAGCCFSCQWTKFKKFNWLSIG